MAAPPASVIFKSLPLITDTVIRATRVSLKAFASLAFKVDRILVCKAKAKSLMGELLKVSLSRAMTAGSVG